MTKISILIWFLIAGLCAQASASTCEANLGSSQHAIVIKNIQQLNPKLLSEAKGSADWANLYVLLKKEEAKYAAGGRLDSEVQTLILSNQSRRYDFSKFTDGDYNQFYVNALRSLYVRVAHFWAAQIVTELNGGALPPDHERIAVRILEGASSPWSLKDRELLPGDAAEFFNEQEWKSMPWKGIFGFLKAWKLHSPYAFSYSDFSDFWGANAPKYGLEFSLYSRLQAAFAGHESSLFCCLSEPGCANCPHNRRWLK